MKKANLGIYTQVKNFSVGIKNEQKLELMMNEVQMRLENVSERLSSVEKFEEDVASVQALSEIAKQLQKVESDNNKLLESQKELAQLMTQLEATSKKQSEEYEALRIKIEEEYINAEDLDKFSKDIEATMQEFIVQQTPRIQSEQIDVVKRKLETLVGEHNALFAKVEQQRLELKELSESNTTRSAFDIESEPVVENKKKPHIPNFRFPKK